MDSVPTDYLRFFCLGKREAPEMVPEDLEEPSGAAATVRETLRHPVYVHSKVVMMVMLMIMMMIMIIMMFAPR